ncbi:hypothetical protein PTI98_003777 [Pleurotus ostreatus]|nr:hypothetical protein PTI98_003777 [Pleurotus ostreatus]
MMNELPIDMNNPHVREYLLLIRLQVLTPLSLLINIGSVLTCSLVADPSIRGIFRLYPAPISPKAVVIGAYVLLIYAAQIGYCVLLTAARKPETKVRLSLSSPSPSPPPLLYHATYLISEYRISNTEY